MTLLIHLLMRLTTMFERGVVADEAPDDIDKLSEDVTCKQLKKE